MKHRIPLPFLFLILVFTLPLRAQQLKDSPDPARLKEHVTYLASDELEGRLPGTPGADKAAIYLASQFDNLKLACASPGLKCRRSEKGYGYLQQFPLVAAAELAQENSLSYKRGGDGVTVALRDEWMPIGFSSNGHLQQARAIFVGYGITASELNHDDYSSVDARGKIAIALKGTPDGENPHGRFGRYEDERFKAAAAKDHGAVALIIVAGDERFRSDRLSQLRYDQSAGDAGIPVAVIGRDVAAHWFGFSDTAKVKALEKGALNLTAEELAALRLDLSINISHRTVPAYNVAGVVEGSDPKLKRQYIIIGAHYDHLGTGPHEGSRAQSTTAIHHGADDNASGTAGLLELARVFATQKIRLRRSVVLIAFSAEEAGLIGSKAWTTSPPLPLSDVVAMINMDMIGRLKDGRLTVGGVGSSPQFRRQIESFNNGLTLQFNEDGFGPSDHSSFYSKQIPVLFFFTGTHEDYHKPSDTAEKINYDGEAKVVGLVAEMVRALAQNEERPTYTLARSTQPAGRSTGFRVYLGTVPNYAESNDGLLLDGVREASPAAKAGLKQGDKIVKLAGHEIRNVYDYTYALGEMKSEQEYEVEVVRGGSRLKLKITPLPRN